EELYTGYSIEDQTSEYQRPNPFPFSIFHKRKEAVSEVVKGLLRIHTAQGCPTQMIDLRTADIANLPSQIKKSPAKVYFFLVGKIIFIQSPGTDEILPSNSQTGPACPEDPFPIVVLPLVLFNGIEYPATAIGVGKHIDKSTRSSCVFKILPFSIIQDFRLDGCCFGMLFKFLQDG